MAMVIAPRSPVLLPTISGDMVAIHRIFCIGRNYADHVTEMGGDLRDTPPVYFTKWADCAAHDQAVIAYPQGTTSYHHEVELVAVIGRGGRSIDAAAALDHVWGYAVGLDMTRRDLQAAAKAACGPWDTAKNVEQSAPVGLIAPARDAGLNDSTTITLSVNGTVRQQARLGDMIWPVADIVAGLSSLYGLEPGDLIFTGTPAGVGPVEVGDRVDAAIAGLPPLNLTIGPPLD